MNIAQIVQMISILLAGWKPGSPVADFALTLIVEWLKTYGHSKNPRVLGYTNEGAFEDGSKLAAADAPFIEIVKSLQGLDANFQTLAQKHHSRPGIVDGVIGPATLELMTLPRCSQPDYSVVGESRAAWALPGCDPDDAERETVRSVRYLLDRRGSQLSTDYLDRAEMFARLCMAEMGLRTRPVTDASQAEYTISFDRLAGSVIGWYEILQGRICERRLDGRLDIAYQPSDPFDFSVLVIHEMWGHGLGMGHTRGGIMNPSILRTPAAPDGHPTWRGDPAESTVSSWLGGRRVSLETTPPKPPAPPDLEKLVRKVVDEYLADVKQGPKGDKGEDGRDGADGRDGEDGRDGRDGEDGLDEADVRRIVQAIGHDIDRGPFGRVVGVKHKV